MPLHLLGKKSWNVYNQDSIARVCKDEAAAELREKEEQRRVDNADAELRLHILRGAQEKTHTGDQHAEKEEQHSSKKQRIESYDDTERGPPLSTSSRQKHTFLTDKHGHVNLFPETETRRAGEGNVELAAESKKRHQDLEDQYTMRLSSAVGRNVDPGGPWYNEPARKDQSSIVIPKNVWGKEDPRRHDRDKRRTDANDPLAMIKKGVKQLREADKHRQEWRAQRERDLNEVEELAHKHKHRRKRRHSEEDSLEGFNLDGDHTKDELQSRQRKVTSSVERHRRHHRDGSRTHRRYGAK